MKSAKMDKLGNDYQKVLQEFFGNFETFQELILKFQDQNMDWDKRWNSFVEGYKDLPSAAIIEDYFYNEDFVLEFASKMVNFVKINKEKLFRTK